MTTERPDNGARALAERLHESGLFCNDDMPELFGDGVHPSQAAAPSPALGDASGSATSGAPLLVERDRVTPTQVSSGAPQPRAEAPVPSPSGVLGTAISSGWASWYAARGDVASVPWWRPGQDPVWAVVSRFADGRTYSVTVLIVGFCQCYVGTPRERLIDLSRSAFRQLYDTRRPDPGLLEVTLEISTAGPGLPATDGEP